MAAEYREPDSLEQDDILTDLEPQERRQSEVGEDFLYYPYFSTHQSPRGSSASIISSTNSSSSRRSRRSSSSVSATSFSTSPSSAPSHYTALSQLTRFQIGQHLREPVDPLTMVDAENIIPCEFSRFTGCLRLFSAHEDINEVVDHMGQDHLDWDFPFTTACWWCDNFVFPTNDSSARVAMFTARMEHIRIHIVQDGHSCTNPPPREDFFMLQHVHKLGLIPHEVFEKRKARKEVPCPDGVYPAGFRPPVPEREHMVIFDNNREEKTRRREMKDKGKARERKSSGRVW